MKYYVYIVQSQKDFGYYIGSTYNLERRLLEHNSGNTKSLKNRLPVKIIYTEEFETKRDALIKRKTNKVI